MIIFSDLHFLKVILLLKNWNSCLFEGFSQIAEKEISIERMLNSRQKGWKNNKDKKIAVEDKDVIKFCWKGK